MTQPTFVPIAEADQVRPARHLHVPGPWTASRPAEVTVPLGLRGRGVGTPGPDSGFALRLARRAEHELKLGPGESEHDVLLGVALIAAKRAAYFGRAPSVYDVQFALNLWGFLAGRAARAHGAPARRLLGDLPRLRRAAATRRLRPGRDAPPRPRGGEPGAHTGRRRRGGAGPGRWDGGVGATRLAHMDTSGAIERLEIEAGGFTFTGRASGPARRPASLAAARVPPDLVGLARPAVGPGACGIPRHRARPARLLQWGQADGRGRLCHRAPGG